jgi:predicted nucleotidyltransferase
MALSLLEQRALAELKRRLGDRFGDRIERLVLFGSRARGEGHEHSDLDVLVLLQGLTPAERREVLDIASDVEDELRLIVAPIVRDPARWPAWVPLAKVIAEEGIPL